MRILISGSSGLIGSALWAHLQKQGHDTVRLSRVRHPGEVWWNPARGEIDLGAGSPIEAAVHLAGENIGARWSPAKKQRIRESRLQGTRLLAEALAKQSPPPRVFISASATGYYGDRGEEWLEEGSPAGSGFLARVCREWEAAAAVAAAGGVRVIQLRTGMVLAGQGGALPKMLPAFRVGLGGPVGSGRQFWSWIALDDVVGVVDHLLRAERVCGPVNNVAPHPATSREFAQVLAKVLRRPALLPLPSWAAEAVLGEMARETLLASQRVRPRQLEESGYEFLLPELESALRRCLS